MVHTVVYPGTFDPITYGHMDIIERIAKIFDKVVVGVAGSSFKENMFSLEERVQIVKEEIAYNSMKNVEVRPFNGLLIDFAKENNIRIIVRGLRALTDFESEFKMAYINHKMNENIETIFLPATSRGHFIASSSAKEIAKLNGDLSCLVSDNVARKLKLKILNGS